MEYIRLFKILEDLMMKIYESEIHPSYKKELDYLFDRIIELKNRIMHGEINRMSLDKFYRYTKEFSFILDKIVHSEKIHPELFMRFRECIDRLEHLNQRVRSYM